MASLYPNKQFSAADIERYHRGELSPSERHALEKAALDDPFLADALEGYAFTTTPAADLQSIRERLFNKEKADKRPVFFMRNPFLRVAALVLLIGGASLLAYQLLNNNSTTPPTASVTPASNGDTKTEQVSPLANDTARLTEPETTSEESTTVARVDGKKKIANPGSPTILEEVSVTEPVILIDTTGITARVMRNYDTQDTYRGLIKNEIDLRNTPNNQFENRAVARTNRAAAPVPETNRGYSNVETYANRKAIEEKSRIADNRAQADTVRMDDIVLTPRKLDSSQVVVLSKSKETQPQLYRVVIDTLEPSVGYAQFDDYIANNLRMPESYKTRPSGEVQLEFDVDRRGQPVNITVLKSLCESCDEEAIRLLKEGPKWKKKRNKKGRITIKF